MPDQIFISYRRDDAAYVTGHINDILRKEFGHESVFTDVDNIALGVDFRAVLDRSVSQCQVFLAVVGDNWLTIRDQDGNQRLNDPADFVRIEIEFALQRNIPIIPLLVGRATMPQPEELPPAIRDFAFRNGTQIRPPPDFNADMERLIRSLQSHFQSLRDGAKEKSTPPKETVQPQQLPSELPQQSRNRISVGADERARKLAELGVREDAPRSRSGMWFVMVTMLALAAGGWFYTEQNPGVIESLLDNAATNTSAADAGQAPEPEFDTADPLSTNIVTIPEEASLPATSPEESDSAVGEAVMNNELAAGAGIATNDELEPAGDTSDVDAATSEVAVDVVESVGEGAASDDETAETVVDEESPTDIADNEVTLTPGTQRQADAAAYIREGVSLAAIGDHEGAIAYFDQVIELGVEPAFAYRNRGSSYLALGQHQAAISDYNEAILLNDGDVIAYYNRGISFAAIGNHTAAVADLDVVIQFEPEYVDAYSKRADSHEALGNSTDAARDRATVAAFQLE